MFSNPTARTPIMLALGFALAVCVGAADAQQPSANAVAAAKELITVKGAAAIYDPLVPGVVEQARRALLQANPTLGKDLNDCIRGSTETAACHRS